jgi:hypothetical protein
MRSLVMVAALAALGFLGPAPAAGGEGGEPRLDRRISVEFRALSFAKCLEQLSEKAGVNVIAEQEVLRRMGEKPVTLVLKDVPIWTVMHLFARSCRLQVGFEDRTFVFEEPAAKPDEVWAKLRLEVEDGEIEVRVLRADVPAELKREVVWRVLRERLGGEEGRERDDRERGPDEDRPVPERGEKPGKPKEGELF